VNRVLPVAFLCLIVGSIMSLGTASKSEADESKISTLKLANLLRTELEIVEGVEVIMSLIEVPSDTSLAKHYHPGEEFVYILEGSGTVWQKGKPEIRLKQGDVFKVPLEQVHTAKTDTNGFKALVFRVHKKGEPERILSD